jgi:Ubiquitin-specific protease C-terminal
VRSRFRGDGLLRLQAVTIYYEVLDMPLADLEQLKALTATLVKPNGELVRQLTVRLAPDATIRQLLDKVRWLRLCKEAASARPGPARRCDMRWWLDWSGMCTICP